MARGFLVKKEVGKRQFAERTYELQGDEIVLLDNFNIRIPVTSTDDLRQIIENHERKMQPKLTGLLEIFEFESNSGTYFPSIARPLKSHSMYNPNAEVENELAKTFLRDNNSITNDIEACFDVASAAPANYQTYGAQFEKIIYFACVGVESLFSKILFDNGYEIKNAGTKTFVRLKIALRIDEYKLTLVYYPWMPALKPFQGWDTSHPSASLSWFDAYNSLKHDKQRNRHKATMENALNAAAAHYVMTYAVFGTQMFNGYFSDKFFFHFETKPKWMTAEVYFAPARGNQWRPRKLII